VLSGREDKNPFYTLPVERAERPEVAGQEVRRSDTARREQYGPVFIRQLHDAREERVICRGSSGNDLDGAE